LKIDRQTRTFAKQVQVDLLGLADAELFQTIQQWTGEGRARYVSHETYAVLGYTCNAEQWFAPAPQYFRTVLTDMPMPLFVQHILPLAFEALHILHPEWGEGATFNAHLANHLRGLGVKH